MLAFDSGTVTGSVQDASGAAVPGAVVFVHRKSGEGEEDCGCNPTANADQNGRFLLRGVAPGEYLVMAVPASELENEWGPGFDKRHEADAAPVTVAHNGTANVTVKLPEAK